MDASGASQRQSGAGPAALQQLQVLCIPRGNLQECGMLPAAPADSWLQVWACCRRRPPLPPLPPLHLPRLQEALLQLKAQVPGLHLKKSSPAQSSAAPFPITAAAEVCAPPAAERYDVQSFQLQLRLGSGVLGGSAAAGADTAGGAAASGGTAEQQGLPAAVEVAVLSPELPQRLRMAMAAELHRLWAASNPGAHERWPGAPAPDIPARL